MSDYPASNGYQADCRITEGATDDLATWPAPAAPEDPKARAARTKAPQVAEVLPASALAWMAEALRNGGLEKGYGPRNWRTGDGIDLSVYLDAGMRHLLAMIEGEDVAEDSLCLHAAHLMATMAIIIDARACDKLRDDRLNGNPAAFARTQAEILERRRKLAT